MTPAEGIRRLGFRRWHGRQLIECHAYLVTGILSLILMLVCVEQMNLRVSGTRGVLILGLAFLAAVTCAWALWRYLSMLHCVQRLADQSVCASCGTYGVLRVVGEPAETAPPLEEDESQNALLRVECRRCGNRWCIG